MILPISIVLAVATETMADQTQDQLIAAIRTAYESNRTSLTHGRVRFRYAIGHARDLENAKSSRWSKRTEADGLYLFEWPRARFELVFAPHDMAGNRIRTGPDQFTSLSFTTRLLTDGQLTIVDRPALGRDETSLVSRPQIVPGVRAFYDELFFPLDLGDPEADRFDLGRDLMEAERPGSGRKLARVDADASLEGVPTVLLEFEMTAGRRSYWVDLERGALPLQILDEVTDGLSHRFIHGDIRHVAGSAWLPFRELLYISDGMVKELVIQDAEFAERPSTKGFQLEFASAVPLMDTARMARYSPRKAWDLRTLPSANSPEVQRVALVQPGPPPPEMPGERGRGLSKSELLLYAGLLLLASGAIWSYWRRRG